MGIFDGKFDSAKQEWETPIDLFNRLNDEFNFTVDLAADITNHKCNNYLTKEDNALVCKWTGVGWLNPPYGSKVGKLSDWVRKAAFECDGDPENIVVMLIPARTNTKWWHRYCMQSKEVRFICGRPKFGGATHGLPQPLALVVFGKHTGETKFSSYYI